MKNVNKKELFIKLIPLFITLLSCIILVSYAYYKIKLEGQKTHFVSTDVISFTYKESEDKISITNMEPKSDTEGIKENYFEFNVASNLVKDISINYEISILKTSTTNSFEENDVKAYLTDGNDNALVNPILISNLGNSKKIANAKVIYNNSFMYNNSNEIQTHTYRLRVWLKSDINMSKYTVKQEIDDSKTNISLTGCTFKFKVNVSTVEQETGADTLIKLTNNQNDSGLYTITHPADSTLQIGATESITEYRYRGASPKNYVTFNNETWRIIGVFPTDDGTGKIENRIKLIRNESIGEYGWDGDSIAYNYSKQDNLMLLQDNNKSRVEYLEKGNKYDVMLTVPTPSGCANCKNNWTIATLKTRLNEVYLNSLTKETQNMIGDTKYYLGGYNTTNIKKDIMYQYERKISGSNYYYGTNPNSWVGKLGIMYASDWGYATTDTCNQTLQQGCKDNNWIHSGSFEWTLTQDTSCIGVFEIQYSSVASRNLANSYAAIGVRPVLYLTSSVKITGGNGTSSSPYTLGL